jgi:hypothetical protein
MSSSVELFRVLNHIRLHQIIGSDFIIYVSDLVRSDESDQIKFLNNACLSHAGFILISIELNSFKLYLKDMLNY